MSMPVLRVTAEHNCRLAGFLVRCTVCRWRETDWTQIRPLLNRLGNGRLWSDGLPLSVEAVRPGAVARHTPHASIIGAGDGGLVRIGLLGLYGHLAVIRVLPVLPVTWLVRVTVRAPGLTATGWWLPVRCRRTLRARLARHGAGAFRGHWVHPAIGGRAVSWRLRDGRWLMVETHEALPLTVCGIRAHVWLVTAEGRSVVVEATKPWRIF